MASASSQEEEAFNCPVCKHLLRDPVAIPCGHNFCIGCINGCWDQEDLKRRYSCPICKHTYDSRPVLRINHQIAAMVKFMKTIIQAAAPHMSDGQALIAEPVTREDFLQYSCHFNLDPNTASTWLYLSEGNRRVEESPREWILGLQSYPDHPDRFDFYGQVLCREGVSARCYWEVEWSGQVFIAVSYKSIIRKGDGDECAFGGNDQSWMLFLTRSSSSFCHNKEETKLPLVASSRIGVYVDHRAGTLAFYSISGDTMTLLHRVHTTFTHTLYPGFRFHRSYSGSVKLL